jgi:DNA processing protein
VSRDPADLAAWVRLTHIPGLGGEAQRKLLRTFGLPEAIFSAGATALREALGSALAERLLVEDCTEAIAATRAWIAEPGNHVVTLADADYPQALLATEDPPVLLYAKGRVELLNRPAIALVGSRNATKQGVADAEAFAGVLSAAGLTIVSGMALGIDAAAHRGGLAGKGSTIAVIGTGADRIYPARNADLARQIAEQGVIIGELPLGTPPLPANFPRRNRIIAGLARGCLVVEAAERSGSLITARLAAESGREVFAIPGSIHSTLSKGCHRLIKQGAKLVESAQDILEELKWEAVVSPIARSKSGRGAQDEETASSPGDGEAPVEDGVLAALGDAPCDLDTLCIRSGLAPDTLLARLLALELDGCVATLPGGRYQRIH